MIASETLTIHTKGDGDTINVTTEVAGVVATSGIENGMVVVFVMGSTAGVTTIEYEPNLVNDLKEVWEKLIPRTEKYHHDQTWGDNNGYSHIRASLLGPSLAIPLKEGKLMLGTWQQIVLVDFDNRARKRIVAVQVIGE
jgi:secondary thiamine-phosphate synthase enzyme